VVREERDLFMVVVVRDNQRRGWWACSA
jgi:hypothetical protein